MPGFLFWSVGRASIGSLCEQNLPFLVFSQVPSAKAVSTFPSFRAPGYLSRKSLAPPAPSLYAAPCRPPCFMWSALCLQGASDLPEPLPLCSAFLSTLLSQPWLPVCFRCFCFSEAPFCPSLPVPLSFRLSLFKCQLTFLAYSVPICEPQTELLLGHLPFLAGSRIHLLRWSAGRLLGCPALPHMLHSLLSMKMDSGMALLGPFLKNLLHLCQTQCPPRGTAHGRSTLPEGQGSVCPPKPSLEHLAPGLFLSLLHMCSAEALVPLWWISVTCHHEGRTLVLSSPITPVTYRLSHSLNPHCVSGRQHPF